MLLARIYTDEVATPHSSVNRESSLVLTGRPLSYRGYHSHRRDLHIVKSFDDSFKGSTHVSLSKLAFKRN